MRVVLYDDESLEPITVLNLPLTERDMLARRVWQIAVPAPFSMSLASEPPRLQHTPIVTIEFEPFARNSQRHGMQRSVFAFTRAADLAMLLIPAWLPGQQSAVRALEDQNDRLADMLMRSMAGDL